MLDAMMTIAAGGKPMFTNPLIERAKEMVNALSVPEISLPFFFMPIFIIMLVGYRIWTKPKIFWPLFGLFLIVYFGSMAVDYNYYLILAKADNVPITLMLIGTGICTWSAFREAAINDERLEQGKPLLGVNREDKVLVWPDLVYTEMICIVIASALLILWAVELRAPLEAPANPAGPPNPSKAPWYFLGLQEMLVYFDPWMAGVILPGLIITGLIAMPYIDTNPKGNGYYTLKQRPFAISVWLFGFIILWVVLIFFGTFLRGPNWNFFGPYEYWDSHLSVPLTNVNLSDYVWVILQDSPLPKNMWLREFVGIAFTLGWVFVIPFMMAHPSVTVILLLRSIGDFFHRIPIAGPILAWPFRAKAQVMEMFGRMYQQQGALRFYIMAFHLVIMAMMPLKMVLRWLLNLKYFVNLPEINLNL